MIIHPFITTLIYGAILAYLFHPLYKKINKTWDKTNVNAFVVTSLVFLLIVIPVIFGVASLSKETYEVYLTSKQMLVEGNIFDSCTSEGLLCNLAEGIQDFITNPQIKFHMQNAIENTTTWLTSEISGIIFEIPTLILKFFVMFFVLFYLIRDYDVIKTEVQKILPFNKQQKEHFMDRIREVTHATIYGNVLTAIIQGTIAGIAFWLLALMEYPITWSFSGLDIGGLLLWTLLFIIMAMIPYLGTGVIWFPASVYLVLAGMVGGTTSLVVRGLVLFGFGLLVVSTIDNILKAKIIGSYGKIHPAIVLVGVLGGLAFIGLAGIVVGPLVLALFFTFFDFFHDEKFQIV